MSDRSEHGSGVEDLVAEIAGGLSLAGEYATRIDLQPAKRVVDFNWAARQAGRRLGIRVDLISQIIKAEGQLYVRLKAVSLLQ